MIRDVPPPAVLLEVRLSDVRQCQSELVREVRYVPQDVAEIFGDVVAVEAVVVAVTEQLLVSDAEAADLADKTELWNCQCVAVLGWHLVGELCLALVIV